MWSLIINVRHTSASSNRCLETTSPYHTVHFSQLSIDATRSVLYVVDQNTLLRQIALPSGDEVRSSFVPATAQSPSSTYWAGTLSVAVADRSTGAVYVTMQCGRLNCSSPVMFRYDAEQLRLEAEFPVPLPPQSTNPPVIDSSSRLFLINANNLTVMDGLTGEVLQTRRLPLPNPAGLPQDQYVLGLNHEESELLVAQPARLIAIDRITVYVFSTADWTLLRNVTLASEVERVSLLSLDADGNLRSGWAGQAFICAPNGTLIRSARRIGSALRGPVTTMTEASTVLAVFMHRRTSSTPTTARSFSSTRLPTHHSRASVPPTRWPWTPPHSQTLC